MKTKLSFFLFSFIVFYMNAQVVTSISYEGNKKTKEKTLKNLTSLKIGQNLDSIILNSDVTLLSRLAVCNRSTYEVVENEKGDYDVIYSIEETNTIIPTVNFWTVNDKDFAYQVGIKEFNFLGKNKEIGAFYRNNGFHSFAINYKDPFLFNSTTGISVILQSLTSLEPLFFDEGQANYQYTNTSIEAALTKRLSASHNIEFGVNLFNEKYIYSDGFQSPNITEDLNVNKILFKGGFEYNKLVYNYQYVEGFKSSLTTQYVVPFSGSRNDFFAVWNDLSYFSKIRSKGNFATRLRLGVATNDDSPFAPFSLDNNLNIRGVGNIIDRGTAVAVLNAEYRYTIFDKKWFAVQTNVFVDAGSWRTPGGEFKDLFNKDIVRVHPGLGLRFIHKKIYKGVLRIDYGKGIINEKIGGIVFGIGQYF